MRRCKKVIAPLLFATLTLIGCSSPAPQSSPQPATPAATPPRAAMLDETTPAPGAQPQLAADPAQLADDLVADERTLRDPATADASLTQAARRQQVAYRAIGRHPEWDGIIRPRIPAELLENYDRNIDARRQLAAMAHPKDTVPAWRINPPAPADELMNYYRESEATSGVGWNYLAAINLVETRFGSIAGDSAAGAQGPMQFMPSTFAAYGEGDIRSPRDSIMAAGRYLAANGFTDDHHRALFHYNHADEYVRAVDDYATAMATDPAAFPTFYRWDVYYVTTAGDVLLPVGYAADAPVPVGEYLAAHPQ